jgi:hypothetical protein
VKGRAPSLSGENHVIRDAKEVADVHTVLAAMHLVCIMDTLHLLARYHGTGGLHEHEYLCLVA